jgi:serine/threonine-protein kinase 24/25/MST4
MLYRPTAKELLRHPFIKKGKRYSHLVDLIDRYRKWKLTHSVDSDSDSDSTGDQQNNSDESDWNLTVKGAVSPFIEAQSLSMAESPEESRLSSPGHHIYQSNTSNRGHHPVGGSLEAKSPKKKSPVKEKRDIIINQQAANHRPTATVVAAKSEMNLVRIKFIMSLDRFNNSKYN